MSKRKKASPKKSSNFLSYTVWSLAFVAIVLSSFVAGYYIGHDSAKDDALKKEQSKEKTKQSMIKKLEQESIKKKSLEDEQSVSDRLKEVLKKEPAVAETLKDSNESNKSNDSNVTSSLPIKEVVSEYENASHEIEEAVLPKAVERKIVKSLKRPKLAIIIDDVSVKSHVNAIKGLHLPITMSFLPPSKARPSSHILASQESFYMVHLPMEAQSFKSEEPLTLRVDDSNEKIVQRVVEIKKLFPKVKYINNHTGSKFTADEAAMDRLISALKKSDIIFVDSRTTGESKAQKISKKYALEYIGRDVFLDHKMDKAYILSQIKKAIEVAKKHGSAIAIGHPHANTIAAINESKKLFADVDLVLVNKL
ncbi:Protein of unknown function DUF610, YibQ [Sulfurimonas denitrificans DSM 1251]|jgi:polysaccharide deacetylase 2 family uncharacterized protein YibQ|uniref:Divergent polysaccharide deacetylase n=1 Tax=Sulfurimonas denitrificans (strain ATCC 33889 / DSM 1251) TaxID=326298 RepID=Q30PZ5_SULDN|nr:divergent polysaccharide deacetylase family protein [Sulfurimonas denitrificans]ABB44936.1 Protein of unknown function DUF610, YibQ [Sulfurimonas denitrificans DSM 1251]MDD3442662.1 divergent polysaccharide deacetylase family protein [Sulfurimonas denitrificans]